MPHRITPTFTHRFLDDVLNERIRHIEKGFTEKHDDSHTDRSIARCSDYIIQDYTFTNPQMYAQHRADMEKLLHKQDWPAMRALHVVEKYKGDAYRRLVIAASLLVAEGERIRREHLHGVDPSQLPVPVQQAVPIEIAKAVKNQTPDVDAFFERGKPLPQYGRLYYVKITSPISQGQTLHALATFEQHASAFWWHVRDAGGRTSMFAYMPDDLAIPYDELTAIQRTSIETGPKLMFESAKDLAGAAVSRLPNVPPIKVAPERQRLKVDDVTADGKWKVIGEDAAYFVEPNNVPNPIPGAVRAVTTAPGTTVLAALDAFTGAPLTEDEMRKRVGLLPAPTTA